MQKKLVESNPVLKLIFNFSLIIIDYCKSLNDIKKYIISKQLFRSGTAIGANSMEAQNAESKADFIHKIKVATKEADETQYWLMLCNCAKNYPDCTGLFMKLKEIQKVLNKIIGTAKRKTPLSYS